FNKYVSQEEIISYVDNAMFSVVLYNYDRPNNKYCEPNRLYQLMTRNIPAVVGSNPTMRIIIEELEAGIVLQDDGRNEDVLREAIESMLIDRMRFKNNLLSIDKTTRFSWSNQF